VTGGHAFDLVVSFETLEHMREELQLSFLSEVKRLLKPDGILLLSTPNKLHYTDEPNYSNPFHVKELYRDEFCELLGRHFSVVKLFGQMVYPVSYIWPVGVSAAATSEHQLIFSRGRFSPVKGDEKQVRYMLAACSQVEQALTGRSLLIDLSHRMTAALQEHISARDRAVEDLQKALDEQKAATDLRVREGDSLADRIKTLEAEAAAAAAHAAAEAIALGDRVRRLETELAGRNAQLVQLRRTVGGKDQAIARAHDDVVARGQSIAALQRRVEELERRCNGLREAKQQRESEVGRLQAVLEERSGLIQRLETTASARDDLVRQLERDLAGRAAWASRTIDELISAHLARFPSATADAALRARPSDAQRTLETSDAGEEATRPDLHEVPAPQSPPAPGDLTVRVELNPPQMADASTDLEVVRRALEAEQSERQRLEGIVKHGYTQLKRRLTEAIDRLVPHKATVAVVSKGDEDLLRLNGRRAWHFPQTEAAAYAGHYPADSAAAIDHLEKLRAKGAQFLAFPATSCWWLDHYSEFAEHLTRRYRRLLQRDDVGGVRPAPGRPAARDGKRISRI
jgi:SAM-dependent methyltransferase